MRFNATTTTLWAVMATATLTTLSLVTTIQSTSAFVIPQSTTTVPTTGMTQSSLLGRSTAATTTSTTTLSSSALSMMPGFDSTLLSVSATSLASASSLDVSSTSNSIMSNPLFIYFAERVIEAAVPTTFVLIVIFFLFSQIKSARNGGKNTNRSGMDDEEEAMENTNAIAELYNDLYGTTRGGGLVNGGRRNGGFFGGGGMFSSQTPPLPKNIGIPQKEYLKVTSLNEKYESYDFSVQRATTSKAQAASKYRSKAFTRAIGLALNADATDNADGGAIPGLVRSKLLRAERSFLNQGKELVQELRRLEGTLAQITIDEELKKMGMDDSSSSSSSSSSSTTTKGTTAATTKVIDAEIVDPVAGAAVAADTNTTTALDANTTTPATAGAATDLQLAANPKRNQEEILKRMAKTQKSLMELELGFIQQVLSAVGPKRAVGVRNALLGDIAVRGSGGLLAQLQDRPLTTLLGPSASGDGTTTTASTRPKNLFVMRFPGDVQASQLNELREEVTGVIRNAQPGDEALLVLQSGGGTVTGYGLAAGQLVRLKEKGLYLTIAVEQVAASGGYMMSCVADKIVASPFAVLGSIGVISEIPNVYERLKQEGIEFQTVTAGKFKRTLTPTKKVSKDDMAKSKEDIEEIFQLFKGWVAQNRPQLNIEEVATGETWFGPAALEKGLCDEIKTVDDILLDYVDLGYKVYDVKYEPPPEVPGSLSFLFASSENDSPQLMKGSNSIFRQGIRWLVQSFAEEVQATLSESKSIDKRYLVKDDTADNVKASSDTFFY